MCIGFLPANAHPARIFMGDTGSLALGGALGSIAVATKHEIVLAIVGGLFVVEALIIGAVAGVLCQECCRLVKELLVIDDTLDVFAVHGVGGILGTFMAGVFAASSLGGVGYAEGMNMGSQVGVQLTGILATLAWTAAVTFVILKVIDAILGLRVTDEEETEGLDTTQHDERGYIL